MPTFNEQLDVITRLRHESRQHEQALYGARIQLQKLRQRASRAQRQRTVAVADRDRQVAELRGQVATVNQRLSDLREVQRDIKGQLDQIARQVELLAYLNQKLAAVQQRIDALRAQLVELQQRNPPLQSEIDRIQTELQRLESQRRDLEDAIAAANRRVDELRQGEQGLRASQTDTQSQINSARSELGGIQGRITDLLQPAFEDVEPINAQIAELEAEAGRSRSALTAVSGRLSDAVAGIYLEIPHPRGPLGGLTDQIPFLLFPVRIETIFVPANQPGGDAQAELCVRIFPDEILIHTHEATLTDREIEAGQLYWVELVVAAHLRAEKERKQRAAWRYLVDLFGGQRAAWVAQQTKPTDWNTLATAGDTQSLIAFLRAADASLFPSLAALPLSQLAQQMFTQALAAEDGDAFIRMAEEYSWCDRVNTAARTQITGFPALPLTKTDAWSRAPRTSAMPDRFVLLLYPTLTGPPREIVGRIIPDTVFLGPDPLEPKDTFVKNNGTLTLGGTCTWMSDFDAAVDQGLGFRVPLSEREATAGFARVVVLGLRLSASADNGATLVEELIANHQFSPKGCSLIPQGTATNNTEQGKTGYSDNDPYDDLAFFTEVDPPAFDPSAADPLKSQTDGRRLADALGIRYQVLQTVQQADQTDILEAYAMNSALFPSTLGYWLENWLSPVVTPTVARLTRTFFTQFVTGRGPLPAIRVGNQPYGVLLTSDMSRWKYPAREDGPRGIELFDEMTPYLTKLHHILSEYEKHWTSLSDALPYVSKPGSDSADVLMKVLGLHPTSVEFFQRIGFHEEYLRTLDSFMKRQSYANELASLVISTPPTFRLFLRNLGIEEEIGTVAKMLAMHVLWQHYTTSLDIADLVDSKPPSETSPLTINYLDWLAKAESTSKIVNEEFTGPIPTALLYVMLRNALLLQLYHGSYDWLRERSNFDTALDRSMVATVMPGIRSSPSISKFELMSVSVEAVQANHPSPGTSVSDWIWRGPTPAEEEAAFVQAQRAALAQLAPASTARLERSLIEHLDCCQYRLDAWETGLFAQRLQAQRRTSAGIDERQTGIYVGAFGWVEELKPSPKTFLRPEALPTLLRPTDQEPVLEEDEVAGGSPGQDGSKQGGFMHAPSFNHAAAAALLRNAYLSHANSAQAEMLSINCSSERVRRAQFVLEGMRNGQPIEALLGYQFERGLHDLTSQSAARGDVPVLELNEFIQPYREAFPFESREIAQAGTAPATETVPPYNVVNGLKLTTETLNAGNGFGLAPVLPSAQLPNASQGTAVLSVRDALMDTLDAVKDLLMAENAYQLVQGNFDRVAAVSLAQKDARIPTSLEVLNTPRGSQFTFTNRVTLHFDDLDPAEEASNPWPSVPMTPRALAEPGINLWLATVLGLKPDQVRCEAFQIHSEDPATKINPRPVTMADLEIQPIDFIALTGINVAESQGATELETRIAYHYRRTFGVAMDQTVRIDFDPSSPAGSLSFGRLLPLARRLRSLINECRALGAQDFLAAAGGKATAVLVDKANPSGYDVAELQARIQAAAVALTSLAGALDGPAAPTVSLTILHDPTTPTDDELFNGPLGDAFAKLDQTGARIDDATAVTVTFSLLNAENLAGTLRSVASFGITDAFPPESDFTGEAARLTVLSRARLVARRLRQPQSHAGILDQVTTDLAALAPQQPVDKRIAALQKIGATLFGGNFKFLPAFHCYNEVDLATAAGGRAQLLSYILSRQPGLTAQDIVDEWLQGLARVRPRLHSWEIIRTLADALSDSVLDMNPVQVPYRNQDSWLAVEFPKNDPLDPTKPYGISQDTLSIAAHGKSAFQVGITQRGLLLDEWTEEIPSTGENTGIAFRFNQPNAAPPQSLLLVVTPEETGAWNWDALVGAVTDTLARAKRRAVEPDQLEKDGLIWNTISPALISEFSTLESADVSLDLMSIIKYAPLDKFNATQMLS